MFALLELNLQAVVRLDLVPGDQTQASHLYFIKGAISRPGLQSYPNPVAADYSTRWLDLGLTRRQKTSLMNETKASADRSHRLGGAVTVSPA